LKYEGQKVPNFYDIQQNFYRIYAEELQKEQDEKEESMLENEEEKEGEIFQFRRWEWFWRQRVYPTGEFPNPMDLYRISQQETRRSAAMKQDRILSGQGLKPDWKPLGPVAIPINGGAGRINGVHIVPEQPNTIWAASAGGGAWKSTDGGKSWNCTTDKLGTLGTTAVMTEPGNPNTVYIATGDGFGADTYFGGLAFSIGIIKSTDGGNTWISTGLTYEQSNTRVICRILVNPSNTQILLAGTNTGVFRSTDGGKNWSLRQTGNIKDMEFKPGTPSTVYATSGGKIFRSIDGGDKWAEMKTGIPASTGRIAIAVTPGDPEIIYAVCARTGSWDFGGFYRSFDGGDTWERGATSPNIIGRNIDGTDNTQQQGWYDLCIAAAADNPNLVFVGGINIWRSTNAGTNWTNNTYWVRGAGKPYVHADIHDLAFSPSNAGTLFSGTDGGVFQTTNRGNSWGDLSDGLEVTQYYRISHSQADPNVIVGGSQDNGTSFRGADKIWRQVWGGDGMDCEIDPNDPTNILVSSQNGGTGRSTDGGNSFRSGINSATTGENGEWVTPLVFVPSRPKLAYAGFNNLWKSTDGGGFWDKVSNFPNRSSSIILIAVAPSNPDILFAMNYNALYKSTDGGANWIIPVFPADPGQITSIIFHPTNPDKVWCSISGFGPLKVYESNDGGMTRAGWRNISAGMPSIPVNCLIYQPNTPDRLYAGTDLGVYYRDTNTKVWVPYNEGMPNVIVNDLEIQFAAGKLRAGTYGRGVWEADLVTCPALSLAVQAQGELTFCQGDTLTLTAAQGFTSYAWSNGEAGRSIKVTQSGSYSVIAYDASGCPAGAGPFDVTVNPVRIPVIVSSNNSFALCDGKTIELDAGPLFASYKWSNGDTTRRITVTNPGVYTVTAITTGGCAGVSQSITVQSGITPEKPIVSMRNDTLVSTIADSYQWLLDGREIAGATSREYALPRFSNIRKYSVRIASKEGCSIASDILSVNSVSENNGNSELIAVYPNPVTDMLMISMPASFAALGSVNVEIVNAQGNTVAVYTEKQVSADAQLRLTDLQIPAGSYVLIVRNKQQNKISCSFIKL
jgi:photosystem II stability/assembly factor-like uncharacterized protein